MKVKEGGEKVGLKFSIQKIKIMASSPITSRQIDGEAMETVTNFIFFGSKITVDDDCSHEIKRRLLLGRKVRANWDSILKSRDITLPTKVRLLKAMFCFVLFCFPSSHVWMWELDYKESWAQKKWCFWTLEIPLDSKEIQPVHPKGNQSWLFIGGTDLKLKLQYFGHLIWRTDSLEIVWCWERLKAGGEGDDKGWDGWMASPTRWTWVWASSGSWWWAGKPGVLHSWGCKESDTM